MTKKTRGPVPQYKFNFDRLKTGKTVKVSGHPEPRHFAHLIRTNARNKGMKVSAKILGGVVYLTLVSMLDQ